MQHTPQEGEITVSVRQEADAKQIVFEVADTGMGIPKEAFGQIFEKFSPSPSRKAGKVSTGLGLPFCKMAVEAHGGQISVESELGQGTIFRFEIPDVPSASNGG